MTTRHKILIDRLIGLPIVLLLNFPVRLLGRMFRHNHSIDPAHTRQIVVAKFLGMGSIVQATPLLRALKETYPNAQLTFLTASTNTPLIQRLDFVDTALQVNDRNPIVLLTSTVAAIWKLRRRRIDHYFDLEVYSAYAAIMSLLSGARDRIGFFRYSSEFKKGIYTHLMYFNTRQAVRDVYIQLGRIAGLANPDATTLGPIRVDENDRVALSARIPKSLPASYVVINPNASDMMLERRWPIGRFCELIEALARPDLPVVLIGSKSESPYVANLVRRLSDSCRQNVYDTAGQLSLAQLLALLESAACVVTNDTGPMHMAIALGSPTVCLFGPVHPDHYGFERHNVAMLYQPVFCSPCAHEISEPPCNGNNVCMQMIPTTQVITAVRHLMSGHSDKQGPVSPLDQRAVDPVCLDSNRRPLGMVRNRTMGL